jgi:radical SAM protein with 4Fe4S-binding SPASM domain
VAKANVAALFDEAFRRANDLGVTLATRFAGERNEFDYVRSVKPVDWTCSEPWSSIWVTSAGEVRTCCTNEVSFGNLHDQTIGDIWNGPAFRAFRAQHARREIASGCANCIANGRVRQSPFFRANEPVTYRPLRFTAASGEAVRIDSPRAGDTVGDPLMIAGSATLDDLELMIDHTPVTRLHRGRFQGEVPIGYVTEGAHVIWARRAGAPDGWGHRQVFLWRATPACESPLPPAPPSERRAPPPVRAASRTRP